MEKSQEVHGNFSVIIGIKKGSARFTTTGWGNDLNEAFRNAKNKMKHNPSQKKSIKKLQEVRGKNKKENNESIINTIFRVGVMDKAEEFYREKMIDQERRIQEEVLNKFQNIKGQGAPTSTGIVNPSEGPKFDQGKQNFYEMPLVLLHDLADAFRAGSLKYELFSCVRPFSDPAKRFYDAGMRHAEACQINPLAIDEEIYKEYGVEVYHSAQVAFNFLLRLHNAKMIKGK